MTLQQLANPFRGGTRVVQMDRRKRVNRDEAGVIQKFGVSPESIPDYLALVGDASGGVDAITAQGLALGFEQAVALGKALESSDLESYQAAHRRLSRGPAIMGKVLLQMGKHATVRGMTMQVLSKQPKLFSGLLAFFVGEKSQTQRFGMNLKHSEII